MKGDGRQTLAVEDKIERVDQIGRRIDEGAIKIKYDGRRGSHRKSLAVCARSCK
jgi:hypothetical protein